MTTATQLADEAIPKAVAQAKVEILRDIEEGVVPASVASFGELHDYVDANVYGGITEDAPWVTPDGSLDLEWIDITDAANEMQNRVDAWLKAGRPSEAIVVSLPTAEDVAHDELMEREARNAPHRQDIVPVTIESLVTDINSDLDLPHGDMRPVKAMYRFRQPTKHVEQGWSISGHGFITQEGLNEGEAYAFLYGMLAGINAAGARDTE